jgi:ATP-binding cassette subfamily B multidrug efflux pump
MTDKPAQRAAPVRIAGIPGPGGSGGPQGRAIEHAKDVRGALRRLMRYLGPYRGALALVTLVAALGTGLALAAPYLMGRAIDQLSEGNLGALLAPVLLMLAAYVLSAVAQLVQGLVMVRVSQRPISSTTCRPSRSGSSIHAPRGN